MTAVPDLHTCFKTLIASPSISSLDPSQDQANDQLIQHLHHWLTDLGFRCEVKQVISSRGKQNLLASIVPPDSRGGLLLSGHTDTVPFDQQRWNSDPFTLTEKDGRWYGLGSCDMKGFFALIIAALQELPLTELKRPLYILATADEETTMNGAKAFAAERKIQPDYAIIGEPTGLRPVYMHKGHLAKGIRITGRSGHSSDPELGLNAIEIINLAISQLLKLREHLKQGYQESVFSVPYPTLNLGHIHGGDAANRICGCCELHLDLRPIPGIPLPDLEVLLRQYLMPITDQYPDSLEIFNLYPGSEAFKGDASSDWSQQVAALSGQQPEVVNYATEAPYLQQLGCQTLVLGPGHIAQAHQPDEYLEMQYLQPTVRLIKELIYNACLI
ncbi:acetylornithine deacetylase [Shewanella sp. NFH-SH190041]|uniref:acetylornithine deacetylase n=1 Tax=Shewanella sp. NFH-SH190041 TaxID=2950245 RepID=UPI0021C36708|nr:acetylornithine deacetylase [Shewanella sp. NFH-SH190041]BDM66120.1 acetylornithine deacetylase [Shewanella sp. NFH-SH190041]